MNKASVPYMTIIKDFYRWLNYGSSHKYDIYKEKNHFECEIWKRTWPWKEATRSAYYLDIGLVDNIKRIDGTVRCWLMHFIRIFQCLFSPSKLNINISFFFVDASMTKSYTFQSSFFSQRLVFLILILWRYVLTPNSDSFSTR